MIDPFAAPNEVVDETAPHRITAFMTETGALYEVDEKCGMILCLTGLASPSMDEAYFCTWEKFIMITAPVEPGRKIVIGWTNAPVDGRRLILHRTHVAGVVEEVRFRKGCCRT